MILLKCQPSSKNSNKPINYFALYVMPCLTSACYFTFGSTGSRLVIPIVTAYHFYCNSGFPIPRICNIFSMLVPRIFLKLLFYISETFNRLIQNWKRALTKLQNCIKHKLLSWFLFITVFCIQKMTNTNKGVKEKLTENDCT